MLLAFDVGLARFALGVERVELLVEAFFGGLARIDGARTLELATATFAWRPARCLANSLVNSLYLLTYPVGWQNDEASVAISVYSLNDLRKHQRIPKGMLEHAPPNGSNIGECRFKLAKG